MQKFISVIPSQYDSTVGPLPFRVLSATVGFPNPAGVIELKQENTTAVDHVCSVVVEVELILQDCNLYCYRTLRTTLAVNATAGCITAVRVRACG